VTRSSTPLLITLLATMAAAAAAAPLRLDRAAALALARAQAPEVLAARAELGVAEGEAMAARAWRHNPELELEAGPRRTERGTTTDRFLRLTQPLDLGFNGRGARIDAAEAAVRAASRDRLSTEIEVLAEVSRAHLLALHARDRQAIAAEIVDLAERLQDVARRRYEAGEVGVLDSQVATVTLAGARVGLLRTESEAAEATAALKRQLGLDVDVAVELAGEVAWPSPPDLAAVRAAALGHPELAARQARTERAAALLREAGAAGRPEFGLSAGVGREEEADLLKFGLSMTLPVLNTGGGERRAAAAADTLAQLRLDAARRRLDSRVTSAWHRQRNIQTAVATYLDEALAAQRSSVRLAEESYRTGKIDLGEVLTVQRELLDARVELANLRLEAALAAVDVHALAALPPLAGSPEGERTP
jgi:cobalt-zinc-cadmium efflux system outer membrane protein